MRSVFGSAFDAIVPDTINLPSVSLDNTIRVVRSLPTPLQATNSDITNTKVRTHIHLLFYSCIQLDHIWFTLEALLVWSGLDGNIHANHSKKSKSSIGAFFDKLGEAVEEIFSLGSRKKVDHLTELNMMIPKLVEMYELFEVNYANFLLLIGTETHMKESYNRLLEMSPHFVMYKHFFAKIAAIERLLYGPQSVYHGCRLAKSDETINTAIYKHYTRVCGTDRTPRQLFSWETLGKIVETLENSHFPDFVSSTPLQHAIDPYTASLRESFPILDGRRKGPVVYNGM
jgi:hypothetical protein